MQDRLVRMILLPEKKAIKDLSDPDQVDANYRMGDTKQNKFLLYRAEGDFNSDGKKDAARLFTRKTKDGYTETALIVTFDKGNKKFQHVIVEEGFNINAPIRTLKVDIKERVCKEKRDYETNSIISEGVFGYEGLQDQKGECHDFSWKGDSIEFLSLRDCGCGASYLWNGKSFTYYQNSVCEGC